jgi:hypothetical protein
MKIHALFCAYLTKYMTENFLKKNFEKNKMHISYATCFSCNIHLLLCSEVLINVSVLICGEDQHLCPFTSFESSRVLAFYLDVSILHSN